MLFSPCYMSLILTFSAGNDYMETVPPFLSSKVLVWQRRECKKTSAVSTLRFEYSP